MATTPPATRRSKRQAAAASKPPNETSSSPARKVARRTTTNKKKQNQNRKKAPPCPPPSQLNKENDPPRSLRSSARQERYVCCIRCYLLIVVSTLTVSSLDSTNPPNDDDDDDDLPPRLIQPRRQPNRQVFVSSFLLIVDSSFSHTPPLYRNNQTNPFDDDSDDEDTVFDEMVEDLDADEDFVPSVSVRSRRNARARGVLARRAPPPPPSPLDTKTVARAMVERRHLEENEQGEIAIAEYRTLPLDEAHDENWLEWYGAFAEVSDEVFADEVGDFDVRLLAGVSESYNKAKQDSVQRFLDIIRRHRHYRGLAKPIVDPERDDGLKVPKLFVALRGAKTDRKLGLLNSLLAIFCMNLRMEGYVKGRDHPHDPKFHYQPNTTAKILNHLFSTFHANGICIGQTDLKGRGSYHAYLEKIWSKTAKTRPEFGRLPKRATAIMDDEYHIRKLADPALIPFEIFRDLLILLFYYLSRDISFRCLEVRTETVDCWVFRLVFSPLLMFFLLLFRYI